MRSVKYNFQTELTIILNTASALMENNSTLQTEACHHQESSGGIESRLKVEFWVHQKIKCNQLLPPVGQSQVKCYKLIVKKILRLNNYFKKFTVFITAEIWRRVKTISSFMEMFWLTVLKFKNYWVRQKTRELHKPLVQGTKMAQIRRQDIKTKPLTLWML